MKKILITGASGYIGPFLCKKLASDNNCSVTAIYNSHKPAIEGVKLTRCDLTNLELLDSVFEEVKPDIVYHLSSLTPTRISNQSDEQIRFFNAEITAHLAKLCSSNGSLMIYTSTDLVYDEGIDLKEDSAKLNPLTIYAITKHGGEEAVLKNALKYFILRTSLVYGFTQSSYTSFYDITYEKLKNGESIKAFADQYRNAIYTFDAAEILSRVPDKYVKNDIVNFGGNEYISRFDMCIQMADVFGFARKQILPISCDEFSSRKMIKRIGLNTDKLKSMGFATSSFKTNVINSLNFKP